MPLIKPRILTAIGKITMPAIAPSQKINIGLGNLYASN